MAGVKLNATTPLFGGNLPYPRERLHKRNRILLLQRCAFLASRKSGGRHCSQYLSERARPETSAYWSSLRSMYMHLAKDDVIACHQRSVHLISIHNQLPCTSRDLQGQLLRCGIIRPVV